MLFKLLCLLYDTIVDFDLLLFLKKKNWSRHRSNYIF